MDEPHIDRPEAERINGFAPGDRVAIVNCELAGGYGKIEHSSGGCDPEFCRKHCRIVYVTLSHKPEGVHISPYRAYWLAENTYRFLVDEVTHVD